MVRGSGNCSPRSFSERRKLRLHWYDSSESAPTIHDLSSVGLGALVQSKGYSIGDDGIVHPSGQAPPSIAAAIARPFQL